MSSTYLLDMPFGGGHSLLGNMEKVEDLDQTLQKIRARGCQPSEALAAPQKCFRFHYCKTNVRVKGRHFDVGDRSHLVFKSFNVTGELLAPIGRNPCLAKFQSLKPALRPLESIGWIVRVRGVGNGYGLSFFDLLFFLRYLDVDGIELSDVFGNLNSKHICFGFNFSNHVFGSDDLKCPLCHRLNFGAAMRPERNRDCSQGGGNTCKRSNPFSFRAEDLRIWPSLPRSHSNARHYAANGDACDKNFKTGGFHYVTSVGGERESYSIRRNVSA